MAGPVEEPPPCDHCGVVGHSFEDCPQNDTELTEEDIDRMAMPHPDRRPPYAVTYSVGGHLYELHIPGDAAVKAVDGALVIEHYLGPVAGIVQVLPIVSGESDGAE